MASESQIRIHTEIAEVPATDWNGLVQDNNPFVRHEFLHALEVQGCLGEEFGWLPCHIASYEDGRLAGAMPLYVKTNSYGEFVFDHAWADAYQRAGLSYFPKLVNSVPYTPAAGQRLLCKPGKEDTVYPLLLGAATDMAQFQGASSFHCLFPDPGNQKFLDRQSLLTRHGCQFHWSNQGYRDFEDFLDSLKSRKRKKIRQERRKMNASGARLRCLDGHSANGKDWRDFSRFYQRTFDQKWGMATLNEAFFKQVADQMPDQVLLILADLGDECIAGSLLYCSDSKLFGRYWGSVQQVDGLHFEACYYQGIEYCIQKGLQVFEPGAQGEHKIARGFLPVLTRSYHWLVASALQRPIETYVRHEQLAVAGYMEHLQEASPYKDQCP